MVFSNSCNIKSQGIIYKNGSGSFSGIDGGSIGNILTSNGTGLAPSFQSPASSFNFVFLGTRGVGVGAVSSISFTSLISSKYNTYLLIFYNVISGVSAGPVNLLVSANNGSSYLSTGYESGNNANSYNSTTLSNTNSTTFGILIASITAPVGSVIGASGKLWMSNLQNGQPFFAWGDSMGNGIYSNSVITNTATNVNAIQIYTPSPTTLFGNGYFDLYGVLE